MKRSTLILASIVVTLAGCSASNAHASEASQEVRVLPKPDKNKSKAKSNISNILDAAIDSSVKRERAKVLSELKGYKTRYALSGSTPGGWDCSGLVMWTYQQFGVELPHRASLQAELGKVTRNPRPGDIVAFYYKGSRSAYHVGIYIGKGKMVHAPAPGQSTRIEGVKHFANSWSKIKFVRVLDN